MAKFTTFNTEQNQNRNSIFRNLKGWKFDEGVWITKSLQNKQFKLPKLDEIDSSNLPDSYFQSGILGNASLNLEEINFINEQDLTGWSPGVLRGQYFSLRTEEVLHGSDSVVLAARDLVDEFDRSYVNLDLRPDLEVPVVAQYLVRDPVTLSVQQGSAFNKVSRFRGIGVNGQELDTDLDPNNIDTNFNQFQIIRINPGPISIALILDETVDSLGGDFYQIDLTNAPVKYWPPQFERTDIFKRELSFDLFQGRQLNPGDNGDLEDGDYAVGYRGHWAEGLGVKVYAENVPVDLGRVIFKENYESQLLFNKDVRLDRSQSFSNLQNESVFYLSHFPVLDLSSFELPEGFGELILDVDSGVLTVDGNIRERVADLSEAGAADEVYQLDPLLGVISFGDGGITQNGKAPIGEIVYTYTQVPFIEYDFRGGTNIFTDDEEDLDPQVNALKQGFLVLDNRRLIPYKIVLTSNAQFMVHEDGSCCYGPIDVPPSGQEDLITLRARVLARGNPPVGVPNLPIQFESLDGLLYFSQDASVTDGEGYAYTEVGGISNISNYIVSDYIYEPMVAGSPDHLNPSPGDLVAYIPPWGAHLSIPDVLTVGERFDGELDSVYVLIQSIPSSTEDDLLDYSGEPLPPDEYLEPYNGITRRGGLTVVWSDDLDLDGAQEVIHPTAASPNLGNPSWTDFTFAVPLPTGHLIVAYKIVIDRTARVRAFTEDPPLVSNQLNICLELNSSARGQWKLPDLASPRNVEFLADPPEEDNLDGSRIGTATFMSPNDIFVDFIEHNGGGDASEVSVGDSLVIVGENFPVTPELAVKVFMIRVDEDGQILAAKNITESCVFVDSEHIEIASLPTPPTGEYDVNYWIAVAGFPVPEDGTRRTAWELEIHET